MADADNVFLSLIAHKIGPFQFDVGVGAVNASIRDQIVRAQMIVRALAQLKRSPATHPLLICGAGIAGLAAATEAERSGLGFILIDREEFPSGALAGSGTRYLSPTMYEWPAPLFDQHRHPPADGAFLGADETTGFLLDFSSPVSMEELRSGLALKMDLTTWKSNATKSVRESWYLPYTRIADSSKVELQALVSLGTAPPQPPLRLPPITLVDAASSMTTREIEVDWIIFAGGFSKEETTYAGIDFKTPPFWSRDDLTVNRFGIGVAGRVAALIVGSGDGAIQDALRCLVQASTPHPVAIWETIIAKIKRSATGGSRNIDAILGEILSLDQYSNTAFMWSGKKEVFESIDKAYSKFAEELLCLYPEIGRNFLSILRDDVSLVHIQRNRKYFTRCYPLNRFLIHLLKVVLDEKNESIDGVASRFPKLVFDHGNIAAGAITPSTISSTYAWRAQTFHRVVIRIGAKNKEFQTISLTGIDPARVQFGRIPPPFLPAKA